MSFHELIPQKSHVNVYYPGAANCTGTTVCDSNTKVFTCTGCDWHFTDVPCKNGCPSQPACSGIDGNTCPQLGSNISYSFATDHDVCLRDSITSEPLVECIYDSTSFDYNDVIKYRDTFCSGNCDNSSNFNEILMPTFCFQDTTVCPVIPGSDTPLNKCPKILSNLSGAMSGNPGADCMDWAIKNPSISDTAMNQYCSLGSVKSNGSNSVCNCINRSQSAVFNYINPNLGKQVDSSCWFIPCANPQAFLVPSKLNNKNCDSTVCSQINKIISSVPTRLTKAQLQNEIGCTITATPITVAAPVNSVNPNTGLSSTDSDTSSSWWIIILIIVLLFVILMIILLFVFLGS